MGMTNCPKPNLLYIQKLLSPALRAKAALSKMSAIPTEREEDDIICHGLFVLSISNVETMLTDTLKYYLGEYPANIDKATISVSKEELLTHPFDLIEVMIDKFILSIAYKPLSEIAVNFFKVLSLEGDAAKLVEPLNEIKATRNILLHNNLRSNDIYLSMAGEQARPGKKLTVDADYLASSLEKMISFVDQVILLMSQKYKDYTRIAAIKRLWYYSFNSPVMPFEEFWEVDEEKDCLKCRKESRYEPYISYSEKMMLNLWHTHFSGQSEDRPTISMPSFGSKKVKVFHLLESFSQFSLQP